MTDKIGCLPVPCATCPYRKDVPSGIWDAEEYAKLPAYDNPTAMQPVALFMCHSSPAGLCTGWLQSHANRSHEFDLLALRLPRNLDRAEVSKVALAEPAVPLFRTGKAAAKHGMKAINRPGKKARAAVARIVKKRKKTQ